MRSLLVLGSTGSIGSQTLELVRADPRSFQVAGLAAARSGDALLEQAREFRPKFVALTDPAAAARVRGRLPIGTELFSGPDAVCELIAAASFDMAVHGVVGAAGLRPSAAVLERGKPLALANKESLVAAGAPLMELSRRTGAPILPVDSEHCAVAQCLRGEDVSRVRAIYLTASGGAFRDRPIAELPHATPADAVRHPNWTMGPRITVGSATLMNKALEVVEAHHLFGLAPEQIRVVLHRQSVVHAMVEFVDGSLVAQMGPPDMRGPLHHALHHPERRPSSLRGFDLDLFRELSFEAVDERRFPALALGYRAVEEGGDAGCVLNAADEVAVAAFLDGRLGFDQIARVDADVLAQRPGRDGDVEALLASDAEARDLAEAAVAERAAAAPGPSRN